MITTSRFTMLTYGVIPSFKEFEDNFTRILGWNNKYRIHNVQGYGISGEWTDIELYEIIEDLIAEWEKGDEEAGSLASSILYTLRFEWV